MRLLRSAVDILVGPLVAVAVVRLGMIELPGGDLILIDPHLVVFDPAAEPGQLLLILILADAGVEAIVPTVDTADEVCPFNTPIGKERASVVAAAVHHRHLPIVADDHQIDIGHKGVGGLTVGQLTEIGDRDFIHDSVPGKYETVMSMSIT